MYYRAFCRILLYLFNRCTIYVNNYRILGALLHVSMIHKERSNKMQQCIDFYYSIFIWSSTCFGRHTAHHQEPKTALAASGFSYNQPHVQTTFYVCKTRGCQCSFRLLMMGGVSPETCWASYKYGIIKIDTLLYLVGSFFMNCTRVHVPTNVMFR